MVTTVDVTEVFKGKKLLLGGLGPTLEVETLTESEVKLLEKFIEEHSSVLDKVSPFLADILRKHKDLIMTFAEIFKAKVKVSFGGEMPSPNSFGIAFLAPYDFHYTDSPSDTEPAYTAYGKADWKISVTAGTAVYLLGDATHFFKMSPTVGKRALGLIFQDGIIEIGTSPSMTQFLVQTEKSNYAPFRINTIQDQPIDPRRPIYVYHTPFAIPLWYDFGIKLSAMPNKTGVSDLRLFGVVFYEHGYHSSLIPTSTS